MRGWVACIMGTLGPPNIALLISANCVLNIGVCAEPEGLPLPRSLSVNSACVHDGSHVASGAFAERNLGTATHDCTLERNRSCGVAQLFLQGLAS